MKSEFKNEKKRNAGWETKQVSQNPSGSFVRTHDFAHSSLKLGEKMLYSSCESFRLLHHWHVTGAIENG